MPGSAPCPDELRTDFVPLTGTIPCEYDLQDCTEWARSNQILAAGAPTHTAATDRAWLRIVQSATEKGFGVEEVSDYLAQFMAKQVYLRAATAADLLPAG